MDEMYHTCRWCKYFKGGKCYNGFASNRVSNIVYTVAEEGDLDGFTKELLEGLKELLTGWKISKKRIKELENYFDEKLPEILDFGLKEKLDENISILYQDRIENKIAEETGIEINDPESFYCCKWE